MLKRIFLMFLVFAMLFSMVACSSNNEVSMNDIAGTGSEQESETESATETPTETDKNRELTIGLSGDAYSLDPYPLNETITNGINHHMFEPLVRKNTDIQNEGVLAESWEANEDGTVWTFHLRKDVVFHNGNKFDVNDVLYTYERALTDMSAFDGMLSTMESMRALDDYTFEMTMNQPNVLLLSQINSLVIMDKETCAGLSDEEIALVPNGTGPYKLVEHVREDRIVFERFEDYWGKKPEATKVTFKPITNEGTRTANIISGAVDMITDVPVRDTVIIETNDKIDILDSPSLRVIYLNLAGWTDTPSLDAEKPLVSPDGSNPFTDIRVREAVYRAIDEETIIKQIMNGFAIPAASYIPAGFNGYNADVKRLSFDPEKAEALLDEAGYPKQDDGYRFEITLDAPNDRYINDGDIAAAVAGYLEKVGIKVNLNLMSRTVFFGYISASNKKGDNTHFCMTGWADSGGESTLMGMDMIYSKTQEGPVKDGFGGVNRGFYTNPEVDALVDEAMSTIDEVKRDALMQEAWKIAADDISYIPLHFQKDIYAVNDRITYTPRYNKYVYAWDVTFND
ncbi:ABC transporter substrate-binding protein [Acidaminobacter sp. JC074]|uniref:ABC transporter substrate-binding protein n=1 Tax=Acidaminobacter sp. JC074 TaxID=2530199 RepID=UPI001F0FF6CD|nr:ABC transporter substrate-binding protein [Acidaminobacter sp. JC074]